MDDFDGKLVFSQPHDGTGRLVFGEQGAVVVPDAVFGLDADLPGLGTLTLHAGAMLGLDADLPGLDDSTVVLQWDANVSRGGFHAELESAWQQALPVAGAVQSHWQQAANLRAPVIARWQEGRQQHGALVARWEATDPLRAAVASHWQEGDRIRAGLAARWEEGVRHRAALSSAWQEGTPQRVAIASHWQEMRRLRAAVATVWQAQGVPMRRAVAGRWSSGMPMPVALRTRWQEAMRPPPGVTRMPQPEPPEPCYDPATVGRLVFTDLALGDGRLVFVCQRAGPGPQPGATVVIPVRRVYMTVNNVSLARADGTPIPAHSFTMSLDMDSWTWQWSASLHATALGLITPGAGGEPVQVIATVNGTPYRLLAESYSRERRFRDTRINVRGRGISALLDVPYSPSVNHGNVLARTAQQLMGDVLTVNGVNFGWDVDWQLTDWLVPGGAWSHQGSYMSALLEIAGAAGGYIQPHDTAQTVRALRRYPSAPWDWGALTPGFELPSAAVSVEGIEWQRRATYDRIFVSGVGAGIRGNVKRAGTAGMLVAPGVTHPLITGLEAARQRGIAELSNTGLQAQINLRLPVLPETGVIKPGAMVRYVDGGTTHLGFVRGTQLEWQWPTLRQLLTVETHPE